MKYKSLLLLLGLIVLLAMYLKIIMVICPSDSGSDEYTDPEGGYAKITVAVYSPVLETCTPGPGCTVHA